jgi:hypothetical protein
LEEWCTALRQQAEDDLHAIDVLLEGGSDHERPPPRSTIAMLFQMVFEKIAKAALVRTDRTAFLACVGKHTSASRFVQILKTAQSLVQLAREVSHAA